MRYDSRLFNLPRLRAAVEICDDLANNAGDVTDALAMYEDAEGSEEREDARDNAWSLIEEILADADRLRVWRDRVIDASERES